MTQAAPLPMQGNQELQIAIYGIPVRFRSPSAEVIAIARDAFAAWLDQEAEPEWRGAEPIDIDLHVVPGDEGEPGHARLRYRLRGQRLAVRTRRSVGLADARRRASALRATAGLVGDREHFRYGVLEALTLWVLGHLDRQPVHAAALRRGESVLLLAGASGVGKSTLAYAAGREGMRVLTEDVVAVGLRPGPRAWGLPGRIHLAPDAVRWFPELRDVAWTVVSNEREKLAVDLRALGLSAPADPFVRCGVCLLRRGGAVGIERVAPAEVAAALGEPEPGFDTFAGSIEPCLRWLSAGGGWRLTLPDSPLPAVAELARIFDALDAAQARST